MNEWYWSYWKDIQKKKAFPKLLRHYTKINKNNNMSTYIHVHMLRTYGFWTSLESQKMIWADHFIQNDFFRVLLKAWKLNSIQYMFTEHPTLLHKGVYEMWSIRFVNTFTEVGLSWVFIETLNESFWTKWVTQIIVSGPETGLKTVCTRCMYL